MTSHREAAKETCDYEEDEDEEEDGAHSDNSQEEDDSGYDISDARSAATLDAMSDRLAGLSSPTSRALSRGSVASSSARPNSSYSESAWSSQELLDMGAEDTSKLLGITTVDLDMFADADEEGSPEASSPDYPPSPDFRSEYKAYEALPAVADESEFEGSDSVSKEDKQTLRAPPPAAAVAASGSGHERKVATGANSGDVRDFEAVQQGPRSNHSLAPTMSGTEDKRSARRLGVVVEPGAPATAAVAAASSPAGPSSTTVLGRGSRTGVKDRRPRERRATSDPVFGGSALGPRPAAELFKHRGSIAVPYSGITISRGLRPLPSLGGYATQEPRLGGPPSRRTSLAIVEPPSPEEVLPMRETVAAGLSLRADKQQASRQVPRLPKKEKTLEEAINVNPIKEIFASTPHIAFPVSRKTQTTIKPEIRIRTEMKSASCQVTPPAPRSVEMAVNTEIDLKLMSKMLQKIFGKKATMATQTGEEDEEVDEIEVAPEPEPPRPPVKTTRSVAVGTEKFSRERFSVLPDMKSRFVQTHASWLRSTDVAVNTDDDLYYGVLRRNRIRRRNPFVNRQSRDCQTDATGHKDAAIETMVLSEEEEAGKVTVQMVELGGKEPSSPVADDASLTSVSSEELLTDEGKMMKKKTTTKTKEQFHAVDTKQKRSHKVDRECNSSAAAAATVAVSDDDEETEESVASDGDEEKERLIKVFKPRKEIARALKSLEARQTPLVPKGTTSKLGAPAAVPPPAPTPPAQLPPAPVRASVAPLEAPPPASKVRHEKPLVQQTVAPVAPAKQRSRQNTTDKVGSLTINEPPSTERPVSRQFVSMDDTAINYDSDRASPPSSGEEKPAETIKKILSSAKSSSPLNSSSQPESSSGDSGSKVKIKEEVAQVSESQGSRSRSLVNSRLTSRDLKTESKVIVEIINSRQREVSEVTSYTEMKEDGKLCRKTTVNTTKQVPIYNPSASKGRGLANVQAKTPEPIITSPPSTKAPSPVSKGGRGGLDDADRSQCSTRPASSLDASLFTQSRPGSRENLLSPGSGFDNEMYGMSKKVGVTDPLHIVINERENMSSAGQNENYPTKNVSFDEVDGRDYGQQLNIFGGHGSLAKKYNSSAKSPPIIWHETSNSTICNEMTSDPFVDDDGTTHKPKAVVLSSETIIETKGQESKVQTKSRASRKYDGKSNIKEPAITSETTLCDNPPFLQLPGRPPAPRQPLQAPSSMAAVQPRESSTIMSTNVHAQPERMVQKASSPRPPRHSDPVPRATQPPRQEQLRQESPIYAVPRKLAPPSPQPAPRPPSPSPVRTHLDIRTSPPVTRKQFLETTLDDDLDLSYSSVPPPPEYSSSPPPLDSESALSPPTPSVKSSSSTKAPKKGSKKDRTRDRAQGLRMKSDESLLKSANTVSLTRELSSSSLKSDDKVRSTRGYSDHADHSPSASDSQQSKLMSGSNQETLQQAKSTRIASSPSEAKAVAATVSSSGPKPISSIEGGKTGTEIVTRITRTTHPEEMQTLANGQVEVLKNKRSRMVMEQELQSGDGIYDTSGCRISSNVVMESPSVQGVLKKVPKKRSKGVVIRELKEDGSYKTPSHSMDDLDKADGTKSKLERAASSNESDNDGGEMLTETKFERFKPGPNSGRGRDETTWEYSMECNCVNGVNATVRSSLLLSSPAAPT